LKGLLLNTKNEVLKLTKKIDHYHLENDTLQRELKRLSGLLTSTVADAEVLKHQNDALIQKLEHAEEASYNLDKQKRQYEMILGNLNAKEVESGQNREALESFKAALETLEKDKLQNEKEYKEKIWLLKEELSLLKEELGHAKFRLESTENTSEKTNSIVENLQFQLIEAKREKETFEEQSNSLTEALQKSQQELEYAKRQVNHTSQIPLSKNNPDNSDNDKSDIKKLREENHKQRGRIEQLMKVINERERRVSELQRYEFSFKKVTEINQQYEKETILQKLVVQELKEQKEALQNALKDAQEHSVQLERAVEHLRGKSEEVKLDAKSFQEEFQKAQIHIEELREEGTKYKEQREELQRCLLQSQERNNVIEDEIKHLIVQLEQAKKDFHRQINTISSQSEKLKETEALLAKATEGREQLQQELTQKSKQLSTIEYELEMMKQTLVKGLKEAKDIKQYYQNLANEKSAALQKTTHMQQHIKELSEEIKRRDKMLEEVQAKFEAANADLSELEKNLLRERALHKEYDHELKVREESLSSFAEQIKVMQSKLKSAEDESQEKEIGIVEAQQQFAKKVREMSQLTEANEDLKRQMTRLQDDLIDAKARASESHSSLEANLEQLRKMQEHVSGTEKKYFRTYERLQEVEAQNKELKKLEQKHHQMQQLLANISSVVGSPVGLTQPYGMIPEGSKPPVAPIADLGKKPEMKMSTETEQKKEKRSSSPQVSEDQSLFDQQNPSPKLKKDLFEQ
jgi:chromosome segregation ATPase